MVSPSLLRNEFLSGRTNHDKGFSVYMMSPAVGVQFMHPSGFALSAEVQYLFKLFNFANGTYAGFGVHWYL